MAWTTPRRWTAGETVAALMKNIQVRDNLVYLKTFEGILPLIIPSARAYNDANISIANVTSTPLTFNSERWDTDTIHSTVTATGRLTAVKSGL